MKVDETPQCAGHPLGAANSSLMTHLGGVLESAGCIVDNAMVIDWIHLVDVNPLMRAYGHIMGYGVNDEDWYVMESFS